MSARQDKGKSGQTRRSQRATGGLVRAGGHAADVLVSKISRRPSIGATCGRSKRDEDVKLASAGNGRGGIEVEATRLAFGLGWEIMRE